MDFGFHQKKSCQGKTLNPRLHYTERYGCAVNFSRVQEVKKVKTAEKLLLHSYEVRRYVLLAVQSVLPGA